MNIGEAYKDKLILSEIAIGYNDFLEKEWQRLSLRIEMYNPFTSSDKDEKWITLTAKVYRGHEDVTDLVPPQGFKWDLYYNNKNYTKIIRNKKVIKLEPSIILDNIKASFALVKMESEIFEYSEESNKS